MKAFPKFILAIALVAVAALGGAGTASASTGYASDGRGCTVSAHAPFKSGGLVYFRTHVSCTSARLALSAGANAIVNDVYVSGRAARISGMVSSMTVTHTVGCPVGYYKYFRNRGTMSVNDGAVVSASSATVALRC